MKRDDAATKRTGQPRCMQRVEIATTWLYLSEGSVSNSGLRRRRYTVDLPTLPMSALSVMARGTYVSFGMSASGPTSFQAWSTSLKTGPSAKASVGSTNAAVARPPKRCTVPPMARRRVIVSPSNAPGMRRSAVYFDFFSGGVSAMGGRAANAIGCVPQGVASGQISGARTRLGADELGRLAPADGDGGRVPHRGGERRVPGGVRLGAERDRVGQLGDRGQGGERGESVGVAAVAVEQREVAVGGVRGLRRAVVMCVAVVHGVDRVAQRIG